MTMPLIALLAPTPVLPIAGAPLAPAVDGSLGVRVEFRAALALALGDSARNIGMSKRTRSDRDTATPVVVSSTLSGDASIANPALGTLVQVDGSITNPGATQLAVSPTVALLNGADGDAVILPMFPLESEAGRGDKTGPAALTAPAPQSAHSTTGTQRADRDLMITVADTDAPIGARPTWSGVPLPPPILIEVAVASGAQTAIRPTVDTDEIAPTTGDQLNATRALTAETLAMLEGALPELSTANRDVRALVPAFKGRLERVIDRMHRELGLTVEVVEATRTQERQDHLYAQGRTQPGQVVTWTEASRHTVGAAADVRINGDWTNRAAFEQLARVAREEGLRTLGTRDPGHIELPGPLPLAGDADLSRDSSAPSHAPGGQSQQAGGEASGKRSRTTEPFVRSNPAAIAWKAEAPATPNAPALARTDGIAIVAPVAPVAVVAQVASLSPPRPQVMSPATPVVASAIREQLRVGERAPAGAPTRGGSQAAAAAGLLNVDRVTAQATPVTSTAAPALLNAPTQHVEVRGQAVPEPVLMQERHATAERHVVQERPLWVIEPHAPTLPATAQAPVTPAVGSARSAVQQNEPALVPEAAGVSIESLNQDLMRAATHSEARGLDSRPSGDTSPVAGLQHTDATERIARVLRMQEGSAERQLSSVVLRIDHPDGGEHRIRVDLRGQTVGAVLDVPDAAAADQLRAHLPELRSALERHGMEGEVLAVRTIARGSDSSIALGTALSGERDAQRLQPSSASNAQSGFTSREGKGQPRGDESFRNQDQQRSRQRRDTRSDK